MASPQTFDNIAAESVDQRPQHRFWGSVRMTYAICAFLAMVVHLCMRNALNFNILCMVKFDSQEQTKSATSLAKQTTCGSNSHNETAHQQRTGDLAWTRSEEILLQGTFYYGYLITLPIAGRLADRFGGKFFFVHSITAQAVAVLLMPFFAKWHFFAAVMIRIVQGLVAGFGNPALYQLFTTWSGTDERTALLSFAYGGYSVGALIIFPISSFLCQFGWEMTFMAVGTVSLLFGICCHWLVYSSLEEHPRLSQAEFEYLKIANDKKTMKATVPWKSILTSVPVYAFTLTHIAHSYGIIVFTLMIPRFFKEAMGISLSEVGLYSAAPFLGSFLSKAISIGSCSTIEKRPNLNLTKFRRIVYASCNVITIALIVGIIYAKCQNRVLVLVLTFCFGVFTDLGFAGAYWPSLLYIAPSYAGLLSGIANCLATMSGFLAPISISYMVKEGTKTEWNYVMLTIIVFYCIGAFVYGSLGSSKLQRWNSQSENNNKS